MSVKFAVVALVSLVVASVLHLFVAGPADTSLLLALIFWSGVGQGALALVATVELGEGEWLGALRDRLLGLYPALLVFPLAFAVFAADVHLYQWSHHQTAWLEPTFFLVRSVGLLALTFVVGYWFARAARNRLPSKGILAVVYLAVFVVTQSLAGVDWVMSFEFPWISTMFPALFFVEAIFSAIAVAVIVAALNYRKDRTTEPVLRDAATLMFGFSLLWGGLFFAQYLTIWYGNIPEEVVFFTKRLATPTSTALFVYVVLAAFAVPFTALISRRVKTSVPLVIFLACLVLSGLLVEKVVYLLPVADLSPIWAPVQLAVLGVPVVFLLKRD